MSRIFTFDEDDQIDLVLDGCVIGRACIGDADVVWKDGGLLFLQVTWGRRGRPTTSLSASVASVRLREMFLSIVRQIMNLERFTQWVEANFTAELDALLKEGAE